MSDEINNNAANVWAKQPDVEPARVLPKKKHKWGMPEVLISAIILICSQVALAAGVTIYALAPQLFGGETGGVETSLKAAEDVLYSPLVLILSSATMYGSWLIMMQYSTRVRGLKSWAKDFWLKAKFPKDILLGLGLAAIGMALVQGLSFLLQLTGIDMTEASNTEVFENQQGFWKYFIFFGLVSIIGPFMEELFFRGFLMQALIRHFRRGNVEGPRSGFGASVQENSAMTFYLYIKLRNWGYKHKYSISAIISSIVFGMMHFQGTSPGELATVLVTGILGLVFAIATIKTQRLAPSIIGHIAYNGTIAIITLMSFS